MFFIVHAKWTKWTSKWTKWTSALSNYFLIFAPELLKNWQIWAVARLYSEYKLLVFRFRLCIAS